MQTFLNRLNELKDPTMESLGELIYGFDFSAVDYQGLLPEPPTDSLRYSRMTVQEGPIEVLLLRWPPASRSAIHYHKGFWGYVVVLEGVGGNHIFKFKEYELREVRNIRGLQGGIFEEPDGTIHELVNASDKDEMITMHIYCPPLDSLEGLVIYDREGRIGVLGENASSASFREPESAFKSLKRDAFRFVSLEDLTNRSHVIEPIVPKPDSRLIARLNQDYYTEQAQVYDQFDTSHESRKNYVDAVDGLVAEWMKVADVDSMVDLACGTGRRLERLSNEISDMRAIGVDLSIKMLEQCEKRGFKTIHSDLVNLELPEKMYDAAMCLYAFGHISGERHRKKVLKEVHSSLKKDGILILDVFNAGNPNEWGPNAEHIMRTYNLDRQGWERGDVFYKKLGGGSVGYLHYFRDSELEELLQECGFTILDKVHVGYVVDSGQIVDPPYGNIVVRAIKN